MGENTNIQIILLLFSIYLYGLVCDGRIVDTKQILLTE